MLNRRPLVTTARTIDELLQLATEAQNLVEHLTRQLIEARAERNALLRELVARYWSPHDVAKVLNIPFAVIRRAAAHVEPGPQDAA